MGLVAPEDLIVPGDHSGWFPRGKGYFETMQQVWPAWLEMRRDVYHR